RQGGAPAAAEYLPAVDAQLDPQRLDVLDQVPRGVVDQVRIRGGAAATALVEQHDPVLLRVVEATHLVAAAATRPTVQQHHRFAFRVPALLVLERVALVDGKGTGVVGLDLGIQAAHARARCGGPPSLAAPCERRS